MKKLFNDSDRMAAVLGFLSLRLWLAVRAISTGLEKFAGTRSANVPVVMDGEPSRYGLMTGESTKIYGWSQNHGIPEALYRQLESEPLLPGFLLKALDVTLAPLLILLGLSLLLGIATRLSLFAMALIYTGLTTGLILLGQDAGIAWLGIHIALIALALFHAEHNRLELVRGW